MKRFYHIPLLSAVKDLARTNNKPIRATAASANSTLTREKLSWREGEKVLHHSNCCCYYTFLLLLTLFCKHFGRLLSLKPPLPISFSESVSLTFSSSNHPSRNIFAVSILFHQHQMSRHGIKRKEIFTSSLVTRWTRWSGSLTLLSCCHYVLQGTWHINMTKHNRHRVVGAAPEQEGS